MYRDYKNDSFLIRNILYFSDMPLELLGHFEEMGKDDLPVLNEYEAEYIAFIFSEFDIKNKKIAFIGGKASFFSQERHRYYNQEDTGVGCTVLYIFNESQKKESGGYDAAIYPWCKIQAPTKRIVKSLQKKDSRLLKR